MAEWKDTAIILRCGYFRETDIWLRALLRERGLQTLFAFGGAKSRRRFCGCLDQFNTLACQVHVSRGGAYLNLKEATLVSGPINLRRNWRAMGIAANCMRFAEACGASPETSAECFALLENLRDLLESGRQPVMTPLFFRLRYGAALGYAPDFETCSRCGARLAPWGYFEVSEGRCVCSACAKERSFGEDRRRLKLSTSALDLLTDVQQNIPRLWPCEAHDSDLRQAARAIDGFVQYHLGLEWDNGNFRRI